MAAGPWAGLLGEPAQRVVVEFSGAGRRKRAADKHGPAGRMRDDMRDHPRGGEHVGLFAGSLDEGLVEPVVLVYFQHVRGEGGSRPKRRVGLLIAAE